MGPWAIEPCRQSELRLEPARARPEPFCRQGFLPPPETSPRDFVLCVPRRWLARYCFVASHIKLILGLAASTLSETSSSRTICPSRFLTSILAIVPATFPPSASQPPFYAP